MAILDTIFLFFRFTKMSLKTMLEYKFDRIMTAFSVFCREMISVVVMYLILIRFLRVKGWEMNEMFFLYSFLFVSYSVFLLFFTGIRDFDTMVYTGELDRFLIRPVPLLPQIIGARADFCAFLGHGTVGVLLLIHSADSVGIVWNLKNILYYIMAVFGGAVIQASIFMVASCFSFWAVKTDSLRNMIFFNTRRFAGYPITFYPMIVQKALIFVVPFAFVSYFPAQFFLRKSDMAQFPEYYMFLPPVVGIILFLVVSRIWSFGLKHYSSAGNSYH